MAIILSLVLITVSVLLLSVLTEDFFIPSLDEVSKKLKLPNDVAGASLMAMGSSAPELFIALLAVFIGSEHSDVGIGTIVGSAVFNILVITGASAAIAGDLKIKKGSVERDIVFYVASIILLFAVFRDGSIVLWEALVFVLFYVFYLAYLWFTSKNKKEDELEIFEESIEELEKSDSLISRYNALVRKLFGYITGDVKKNYVWTMLISVIFIAGVSYLLVESAMTLSRELNLNPVIVSLTLLAAATSIPDLLASIGVAKQGRGNMAVANAVGSNTFDILIGLGLPWLIVLVGFNRGTVNVEADDLMASVIVLFATTILLYIFLYTGRVFRRWEGIVLLMTYVAYVGYIIYTTV